VGNLELIAYASIGLAVVSLLIAILALNSAQKSRRQLVLFRGSAEEVDILTASAQIADRIDETNLRIHNIAENLVEVKADLAVALRHTAIVRYNAFSEAGGQFSFSAAFLDDYNSGVIISGIQGGASGRVYAKAVINGESEHTLTPEEKQALANATARRDG
jgi:hypothetical protein